MGDGHPVALTGSPGHRAGRIDRLAPHRGGHRHGGKTFGVHEIGRVLRHKAFQRLQVDDEAIGAGKALGGKTNPLSGPFAPHRSGMVGQAERPGTVDDFRAADLLLRVPDGQRRPVAAPTAHRTPVTWPRRRPAWRASASRWRRRRPGRCPSRRAVAPSPPPAPPPRTARSSSATSPCSACTRRTSTTSGST